MSVDPQIQALLDRGTGVPALSIPYMVRSPVNARTPPEPSS